MQKYDVMILKSAEETIRKNFEYIAKDLENEPAAYAHTIDIYKKIQALGDFPEIYAPYDEFPEFRVVRARQYRIFYKVDKEKRTVYVTNIMHSHQDPSKLRLE